ncbi:V-type proton ATPase subunit e 2-like [Symsagittifera roscoffensis]|uniref:V-type proton ATPase subunit e 2-like n=1 Tax=Symsagittifera roscoffensis TaxID=84072 RepID=UPI00307CAEE5
MDMLEVTVGMTGIFTLVALLGSVIAGILIKEGYIRKQVQVGLILTAIWMYMFWLCVYLQQTNPLVAPDLKVSTAQAIMLFWKGNPVANGSSSAAAAAAAAAAAEYSSPEVEYIQMDQ